MEGFVLDKRKVIAAYRKGLLSLQECAQILGIDSFQLVGMVDDFKSKESPSAREKKASGR
jgi:hypothetical protein